MGNNEMQGPFGVSPISGPAAPGLGMVRLSLALRATRIGQLAERITEPFMKKNVEATSEWEGVRMFREHKVAPNDPRKEVIYANFQSNLKEILKLGLGAGAKPILSTVASNQRDFAPLASIQPGKDSSVDAAIRQGIQLQSSNLFEEATTAFTTALPNHREFADLHFRLGQTLLELGSNNTAHTHFRAARDLDALPLRTDGRINELIREAANQQASSGVRLVDADRELAANLPALVPGDETFFDHVHLTFPGNYRLARLFAAEIEKALPPEVAEKRALNWPSAQVCDRELGLTDWNRRLACENMLRRQVEPPFSDQSNHSNRVDALSRTIVELRDALSPRAATNATAIYQAALQRHPEDFRLRENFAEFLEATGRFQEAATHRVAVAQYVPHDPVAAYHAGRMLGASRNLNEARSWFQKALELRPQFPEAHLELGRALASDGKHTEALDSYDKALQLRPDDVRMLIQRAHSLAALNRRKEAMDVLRAAIRARPNYWEPHYLLAIELAANNQLPEALAEFHEVTRLRPDYAQARFNLAVALAKLGKLQEAYDQFQKTLEIEPNHKSALEYSIALESQLRPKP
jgi:tetratricopeptide (TPR) repeat protein